MTHTKLATLIPLALTLALGPGHRALAASPAPKNEPTAEDASWLAAASAQRLAGNGHNLNGRRANGTTLAGHSVRSDGGMTVVSIVVPGGARHAK